MLASTVRTPFRIRCHFRPLILVAAAAVLFGVFWFASRYPQLFSKADHVGQVMPIFMPSSQLTALARMRCHTGASSARTISWLVYAMLGKTCPTWSALLNNCG